MAIGIQQLHPHFVGEVSGIDLTKPLTSAEAREIEAGMDKYAVLVFHDQDITDDQQLAFAENFGPRENRKGGSVTKKDDYRLASGLADVGNLDKSGKPLPRDHRTHLFNLGNCLAFRQFIPADPREILAVVGARGQSQGRQHRIRRYARRL